MNLKFIPAKASDYGSKFQTCPVSNFEKFQEWRRDDPDYVIGKLYADNRQKFQELFGDPQFYYLGEFKHHCWVVDLDTAQLLVLTAKGKGTGYEVIFERAGEKIQKDMDAVIEFLEWLNRQLADG